jgi:hypothetical protein
MTPVSTDKLFSDPEPDRFTHESPIRAFTDWTITGLYAVGKGFRPSIQHLTAYLDAMERKEGWQLVQILHAEHHDRRTLLFRKVGQDQPKSEWDHLFERISSGLGIDIDQLRADFTRPVGDPVMPELRARMDQHDYGDMQPEDEPLGYLYAGRESDDGFEAITDPRTQLLIGEDMYRELKATAEDDPVNPRHYGGDECAQIGERLTPNAYQVLKYIWRLGEKDDPCIELGKSLWYLDREINLGLPASRGLALRKKTLKLSTVERLCAGRKPLVLEVTTLLHRMCFSFGTELEYRNTGQELRAKLLDEKSLRECDRGRGQQP